VSHALTAEELHYLAAAQALEFVPALGPLPLDDEDPAARRLLIGTAERSLGARRDLDQLRELLAPLAEPPWTAMAEVAGPDVIAVYGWWPVPAGVAVLSRIAPTDYALDVAAELRANLAGYLALGGDDERAGAAQLDDVPEDATIVRAARLARGGEGVALEWADAGDGPVWVVEPDGVTLTGRAAVLRALLDGHLD
jgi:hypothetical protein